VGLAPLPLRRGAQYYLIVSTSSLSPDEIRAAAETHNELGKDYSGAVIESFLEKVGSEIDARVDSRLNRFAPSAPMAKQKRPSSTAGLGIVSLILGIPITAIVAYSPAHLWGLIVVWLGIAVINIAHAANHAATHQPNNRG
jgi:hypothetical protein